ncbi:hypothetical protein FUA23_07075 [Neolewinella aurantiaca]|uniref:Uncharacterized protein n=1 Tax=Neolewinella aurantiaca TaxID=2602767 RepID=A0A5C7FGA3_9BACT|nr:hypothetical protein [Neolewinella aurantiaca]TXF90274.1 hypothetical protein FUA23_07075 [Neolewinella aurantiaca]
MKFQFILLCLIGLLSVPLSAQDILLDEPVRAGELTLFQSLRKHNEYRYALDKPQLAKHPNGKPQFSFIRYVSNESSAPGEEDITEGQGGGIIHAVIELKVTEDQLAEARRQLRRINPNGTIAGAAPYTGGTVALISTVADPDAGFSKKVLGVGRAPILDGQKAAVSIQLTKLGAQVLWQSFQTPTPDMSFSFEMELEGLNSPKGAVIEANFEQIYKHQNFGAGMVSRQGNTMLGAEINATFEDLTRSGAIKVTTINPDADIEAAVKDAYTKLTALMFDPSGSNTGTPAAPALPGAAQPGMLERAQTLLAEGRKDVLEELAILEQQNPLDEQDDDNGTGNTGTVGTTAGDSTRATSLHPVGGRRQPQPAPQNVPPSRFSYERPRPTLPTTAIVVGYTMRDVRQKGTYRIDLTKYTTSALSLRFDHNVGPINCEECFQQFNIDDPLYQQREIAAILDGFNAEDFQRSLNFVSVAFRKKHQNGETTEGDIRIDRSRFNQDGNYFKFTYGWKGDDNRSLWRGYEYQTVWSFFGGVTIEGEWNQTDINTLPLSPPYRLKSIIVEMDPEIMAEEEIRSAQVDVFFTVGDQEQTRQVQLRSRDEVPETRVEIMEPAEWLAQEPGYEYQVTWRLRDGTERKSPRKESNSLLIYADQL